MGDTLRLISRNWTLEKYDTLSGSRCTALERAVTVGSMRAARIQAHHAPFDAIPSMSLDDDDSGGTTAQGTPFDGPPFMRRYEKRGLSFTVGPSLIQFCDRGSPYFELSSYFDAPFTDSTKRRWPTVQHFYQAMKFRDPRAQERIRCCTTAAQANELGHAMKAHVREDFYQQSKGGQPRALKAMLGGTQSKFLQNQDLAMLLINTSSARLVEHSVDKLWGDGGDGSGQNMNGKILEKIREQLIRDHQNLAGRQARTLQASALGQPGALGLVRTPASAGLFPMGPGTHPQPLAKRTYSQLFPEDDRPLPANKSPKTMPVTTVKQTVGVVNPAAQRAIIDTFNALDSDRNGFLNGRDWDNATQTSDVGVRTRQNDKWKRLRESMDFNNDGQVDPEEFTVAVVQHALQEAQIPAAALFDAQAAERTFSEAVNKKVMETCQGIAYNFSTTDPNL